MATAQKKYRRKQKQQFPVVPVVIGLLLIGIAVLMMAFPGASGSVEIIDSVTPMQVNYVAPELALQNIQGKMESLSDYRDTVVLVNNWATWCPPCKAEMPTLVAYHNEHHVDGFSVIAVEAGEPVDLVAQFAKNYGMNFPVWLDPNNASARAFGNNTLPNSYVIDRAGTVRYAWTGAISRAMLEKYITPLIAENDQTSN